MASSAWFDYVCTAFKAARLSTDQGGHDSSLLVNTLYDLQLTRRMLQACSA